MSNQLDTFRDAATTLARGAFGDCCEVRAMTPLAGDASSRSYARIAFAGAGPVTAVLMIAPGSGLAISSEELAVFAEPLREMPFLNVQRYLRSVGVAVPEVYASDAARGLVLLEDIGDTTLWDAARDAAEPDALALYRAAIDELVAIQAAGERRRDSTCIAFRQRFDARLFLWEFDHFLEYGFRGRSIPDADRRAMREVFAELADDLASGEPVLAHRDYHSWNLFAQAGRVRVIDFQDALLAPVPYDLATLLNDRATPHRVTPPMERHLVEHFLRLRAEQLGDGGDLETLLDRYHRFVLQKSLKIVGRFHYLEEVKGRRGYVAMLPDTFATLRRCLENLPGLSSLRRLLARSFPEIAA